MSPVALSATLIVRDEAPLLPDCLASLGGVADEVVVVDTGSKDGTPELAEEAGARVLSFPWVDNFAAARNVALDAAVGEWVLYLDADERVRPLDVAAFRASLDDAVIGRTVRLHPRAGWTAHREYRLWRNDPRIRFQGVIHETVVPSLRAVGGGEAGAIVPSSLEIDHLGYEGDMTEKWRRNLPLLEHAVRDTPGRIYLWHELGRALHGLGRPLEADAAWVHGTELALAKRAPAPEDVLPFLDLIDARSTGGHDALGPLLDVAAERFPDDLAVRWRRARSLAAAGRYRDAVPLLEALAAIDPDELDGPFSYEQTLFTTAAPAVLAGCFFRLGRHRESAEVYERLASKPAPTAVSSQDAIEYRTKAALARARAAG